MRTYLYCYANGVAKFGKKIPKGALPIDSRTDKQIEAEKKKHKKQSADFAKGKGNYPSAVWKDRMKARLRLGYDGKTLLVPGIPEAADQVEAYEALAKFKQWAVK